MSDDIYAGSSYESYQPAPFIVGGLIAFDIGTLASGQNLTKGAVIGRVTASGKLVESQQDATDGSEEPIGALNHDCDASAADANCVFVKGGDLDAAQVSFHSSWTDLQKAAAFDRTPISLVTVE